MRDATKEEKQSVHDYIDSISQTFLSIPIPENPTNGDMIKAVFPNATFYEDTHEYGYVYSDPVRCSENYMMTYDKDWWNAPYKAESEE